MIDEIEVLKGADRIRKRPLVVFEQEGTGGCLNAIERILKIFINEVKLGFCNKIFVAVEDNVITVKSFDRGFLLSEEILEGKPMWYYDFCEFGYPIERDGTEYIFGLGKDFNPLYGGDTTIYSRFDNDAFFDLTCVQMVSEYMAVASAKDGFLREITFEKGDCVKELTKKPINSENYTQLRFKLDFSVFGDYLISKNSVREIMVRLTSDLKNLEWTVE